MCPQRSCTFRRIQLVVCLSRSLALVCSSKLHCYQHATRMMKVACPLWFYQFSNSSNNSDRPDFPANPWKGPEGESRLAKVVLQRFRHTKSDSKSGSHTDAQNAHNVS